MLKLINIKINGDYIEADYIPEDSKNSAHVKLGIKDESEEGGLVDGFDGTYRRHAYTALEDIYKETIAGEELPKTRLVMWY